MLVCKTHIFRSGFHRASGPKAADTFASDLSRVRAAYQFSIGAHVPAIENCDSESTRFGRLCTLAPPNLRLPFVC
jgi:hypothetical protein